MKEINIYPQKNKEIFKESKTNNVLEKKDISYLLKTSQFFKNKKYFNQLENPNSLEKIINDIANSIYDVVIDMKSKKVKFFMPTENSGTYHGIALKEAFKVAFPKEKIKVVPINIKSLAYLEMNNEELILEINRLAFFYKEKLKKIKFDFLKDKIYLYDESSPFIPSYQKLAELKTREEVEKYFRENKKFFSQHETAFLILKLIGVNIEYPSKNCRSGSYGLNTVFTDTFENKNIFYKEGVTLVLHPEGTSLTLKDYQKLEPKFLTKKPKFDPLRAQNLINDLKIIGKMVGEKIKKEIEKNQYNQS